jgi:hypothetical protein
MDETFAGVRFEFVSLKQFQLSTIDLQIRSLSALQFEST